MDRAPPSPPVHGGYNSGDQDESNPAPTPGPGPTPGFGCMGYKDKKECLAGADVMGGGCAWCDQPWLGESCVSETQAKFMPGAKCALPDPEAAEGDASDAVSEQMVVA